MVRSLKLALAFACALISVPSSAEIPRLSKGLEVARDGVAIRVEALTDSVLRVRLAPGGRWSEDASWAVPPAVRHQNVAVEATSDGFCPQALRFPSDPRTPPLTLYPILGAPVAR